MVYLWFLFLFYSQGAGKSTLLNFLAGRSKGMELTDGEILINGQKPTKTIRRRIGYVLQEDVFFSHLTVNQTLKVLYFVCFRVTENRKKSVY